MAINFQQKRRTAAVWTSENPKLLAGQIGWESDTNNIKFGDGATFWTSLAYISFPLLLTTATGLTAGTTQTQADGFDLTAQINEVSTVANESDTVVLPTAVAGDTCLVVNNGANGIRIFPASSDNLGAGANTALTINLGPGYIATFYAYDVTNWIGTVIVRET